MNLNQLQYFVTLAHKEHYIKAAEELAITQPSLSHAIHLLEEELNRKKGTEYCVDKIWTGFSGICGGISSDSGFRSEKNHVSHQ